MLRATGYNFSYSNEVAPADFVAMLADVADVLQMSDSELQLVRQLAQIHVDSVKLGTEMQKLFQRKKMSCDKEHNIVNAEQFMLLQAYWNPSRDFEKNEMGAYLKNFWFLALCNLHSKYICEVDEDILQYLLDVRCCIHEPLDAFEFTIEFHFAPNPYFTNTVLTKFISMVYLPISDNPMEKFQNRICKSYKFRGCVIDWKQSMPNAKFFDYFYDVTVSDRPSQETLVWYSRCLEHDMQVDMEIRLKLIPKALYYFMCEVEKQRIFHKYKCEICRSQKMGPYARIDSDEETSEKEAAVGILLAASFDPQVASRSISAIIDNAPNGNEYSEFLSVSDSSSSAEDDDEDEDEDEEVAELDEN